VSWPLFRSSCSDSLGRGLLEEGEEPLLLSCAENDQAFNTESRRRAVDILKEEKKRYSVQLFQGVSHGFAVKGDPDDPYQRESPPLVRLQEQHGVLNCCVADRLVQGTEPQGYH